MAAYIARNHIPEMVILLSKTATPQEKYAAKELASYLGMISAAALDTVYEAGNLPYIALGKAASEQGVCADRDLGNDGFSLQTKDGNLYILGGKRGVIYGVYEFLEKLGCRFFTATCEKIPVCEELALPDLNDTQVPILEYREHNYTDVIRYPSFAVKCRLNGGHHPIPEEKGGNMSYAWYVHTFEKMVPPAKYAAEHPEYFALVDGERPTLSDGRHQLCLTNPDVLQICIESVRQALLEHPEASIISVSQNDWWGNCTCDACRAIDEEEGSEAGSLIRFVNAIAEALEDEFPHIIFDTLAYHYSRPATRLTRPRHNVCVRLCSIECCFSHPFDACDDESRNLTRPDGSSGSFISDLQNWGKVCDRMYIWDYTTNFNHYPTPFPNWRTLQPNMRAFVKNNVKGVFEQANSSVTGGTDLNELRLYLLSKLLWNAEADVDQLMTEFLEHYYGAAAPYFRQYIDTLCDKVAEDHLHVGIFSDPKQPHLAEDMLDIYDSIFDKAEAAVVGDTLRAFRVGKARLSIRYIRIKRKSMLAGQVDATELRDFFTDWQSYGLVRMEEWCSPKTSHRALLKGIWKGIDFYEHWAEEGDDSPDKL